MYKRKYESIFPYCLMSRVQNHFLKIRTQYFLQEHFMLLTYKSCEFNNRNITLLIVNHKFMETTFYQI
jgi:hypothetical protein